MKKLPSVFSVLATVFWLNSYSQKAQAQIIPNNDGTNTIVNPIGNQINITGGTLSQDQINLFHSFSQFNLNQDQIANFLSQPNIINILGRITNGNPSYINGLIQVTGGNSNLFLMNPAGIIFGNNASLNVPGDFTATTATGIGFNNIYFNAFGNNNYAALVGNPQSFVFNLTQPGTIINTGNLTVSNTNTLSLIGGTINNTGTLTANQGNINIVVVPGTSTLKISQPGSILTLEVNTNQLQNNQITGLSLPGLLTGNGVNNVSGNINVGGGKVQILGDRIALQNANINANGNNGGGTVLIGGDFQGKGVIPNAKRVFVDSNSVINANGLLNGNGGKIIVWSDEATRFYGTVNAKGYNGGFVEISGKNYLDFIGKVDLSASQGKIGTLLLDPIDITVIAGINNPPELIANDQFADPGTSNNIANATINNATANVILQATGNINFNAPINITTSGVGITAQADNNIIINSGANITTNGGNITLNADNDQGNDGKVLINNATIITLGGDFTAKGSLPASDPIYNGGVHLNNSKILTGSGNITLTGYTSFLGSTNGLQEGITILNSNLTTGLNGNINLTGTGRNGLQNMDGIYIDNGTIIRSQNGNINLTGIGGNNSGNINIGILIGNATIQSTGNGTINLIGTGGNGGSLNLGVDIVSNTTIAGFNGAINITGTGQGTGTINYGVGIDTSKIQSTGNGSITITGTGVNAAEGIRINNGNINTQFSGGTVPNVYLKADEINILGNSVIQSAGSLQIQTLTPSVGITIGGTVNDGNLNFDSSKLSAIQGYNTLFFNTLDGNIIVAGNVNFNRSLQLSSTTGNINTSNANITGNSGISLFAGGTVTLGNISLVNTGSISLFSNEVNISSGSTIAPGTGGSNQLFIQSFTGMTVGGTVNDGNLNLNSSKLSAIQSGFSQIFLNGNSSLNLASNVSFNSSVVLGSSGNINTAGFSITGSGNITLSSSQNITIDNNITTNNGNIILNGNLSPVNITVSNATISSTGGNISISLAKDIYLNNNAVIRTTDGNISLTGNTSGIGILLQNSTIESIGNGSITLNGITNANGAFAVDAILLDNNSSVKSVNGNINITGFSDNPFNGSSGLQMGNNSIIQSTGSGVITINGTGGNQTFNDNGIDIFNSSLISNTGNINLTGVSRVIGNNVGISIIGNGKIQSTGNGTINLTTITPGNTNGIVLNDGNINPTGISISNINITSDEVDILGNSIIRGGTLQIKPSTSNLSITIGGSINDSNLNLDSNALSLLQSGFNQINIGNASTGNIIIAGNTVFNQPITLSSQQILINNDLQLLNTINFNATNTIIAANLTTNNQNININSPVNLSNSVTLNSGTGTISFGNTVNTGTNNLTLIGDQVNYNNAISGTGNLSILPSTNNLAIALGGNTGYLTSSKLNLIQNGFTQVIIGNTSTGNITISGNTTFNDPVNLQSGQQILVNNNIQGLDNASITLNANQTNLSANISTNNQNININSPVTLIGNSTLNSGNQTLTFNNTVNTGTNNLTLIGDQVNYNNAISGTGNLSILPSTNNLAIALGDNTGYLTSTKLNLIQNGFTQVIIGNTSTGNITISGNTTFNDPITLQSGQQILVNNAIQGLDNASITLNANQINLSANISTNNQNINLNSPVILIGNSTLNSGNQTLTFNNTVNTGTNNLTLIGDQINYNSNISGTGNLSILPSTNNLAISLGGTTGYLTNTKLNLINNGFNQINIGNTTTGNITIAGTSTFNDPVTLRSAQQILVNSSLIGLDNASITLNALSAGVRINSGNITTAGGNFTAIGNTSTNVAGIFINTGRSINTGTGDINLTGTSTGDTTFLSSGIRADGSLTTTSGNIILTGYKTNINGNSDAIALLSGATITTTSGNIILTGTNAGNTGIAGGVNTQSPINTNTGNIIITGNNTNNNSNATGILTDSLINSNTGNITLTGTSSGNGTSARGINLKGNVTTNFGNIILTGNNTNISGNAEGILSNKAIASNTGNITLIGSSNSANGGVNIGNSNITSNSTSSFVNISSNTGNIILGNIQDSGNLTVNSAANITQNTNTSITVGNITNLTTNGNITLTNNNNFNQLIVSGNNVNISDSNNLILGNSTFSGNLTVNTLGGDITSNNLTGTGNGTNLTLQATNDVLINGNITNTGNVKLIGDSDNLNDGKVLITNSTINTNGGDFTANGSLHPTNGTYVGGVQLNNSIINTGNGNINLTGFTSSSGATNTIQQGITLINSNLTTTGNGNINLTGTGRNGFDNIDGIFINTGVIKTENGNINLIGIGGNNSGNTNIGTDLDNSTIIQSTGTGNINITGIGGNGVSDNFGVVLYNNSNISSVSGNINITGTGKGTGTNNLGVWVNTSKIESTGQGNINITGTGANLSAGIYFDTSNINPLGTSTGNISLITDKMTFINTNTIKGAETVQIKPLTPNFNINIGGNSANSLILANNVITSLQNGFNQVIIGNATTGNITISENTTFNDPVTLQSGQSINVNNSIQGLDNSNITLIANQTNLSANISTTNQNININSPVTLTGNSTINSGNQTLTFNNTVNTGTNNLTLIGDQVNYNNAISGTGNLTILPSGNGAIALGGNTGYLTSSELSLINNGFNQVNIGNATTGNITISANVTFNDPVTLQSGQSINVNNSIQGLDNATITLNASNTNLGANISTTNQNININSSVTLTGNRTLNAGNQTLTFNGTVNTGTNDLTLIGDQVNYNNAISGTGNLTILPSGNGAIALGGNTGYLTNSEINLIQNGFNQVIIGNATTGNISVDGNVTFSDPVTLTSGQQINVNNQITTLDNGSIIFNATNINLGSSLITTNNITINNPLNLTNSIILSSSNGVINLGSNVNLGSSNLTLIGDIINYSSNVSGTGNLKIQPITNNLAISLGGNTGYLTNTQLNLIQNGFSTITIGNATTGNITISANVTFNDPVTLQSGQSINVNNSIQGLDNATITLIANNTNLGANISTNNQNININSPVILTGNRTLNVGNQTLTFNSTVNTGTNNLTLIGDQVNYNNAISGTGNLTILPSGNGAIALGGNTGYLTSSELSLINNGFNQVNIGNATTGNITISGNTTFNDPVNLQSGQQINVNNNIQGVDNSTVTLIANQTNLSANISTNNQNININSPVILTGNSTINSGNQTLTFNSTVNTGTNNLTLIGDQVNYNNAISGNGNLSILPSGNGAIALGGNTGYLTSSELNLLQNGFNQINIGNATTGNITIASNTNFNDPVTLTSGQQINVNNKIQGLDNSSINLIANQTNLGANINTNNQNISINKTLNLSDSVTINSGNGVINLGNVEGNQTLTLNSGTGNININGTVGSNITLTKLDINSEGKTTINGAINAGIVQKTGGETRLLGNIITSGNQIYNSNVTLDGDLKLSSANGAIIFKDVVGNFNVSLTANNDITTGNINLSSSEGNGGNLNLTTNTGNITIGDINTGGLTGSGNVSIMAINTIKTGKINTNSINGNGGNVFIDPQGDVQVDFINSQGGVNSVGGNVDITTQSNFKATGTFIDQNGILASISTAGGLGGGKITIRQLENFTVGDPSGSGTLGSITTGLNNTISPSKLITLPEYTLDKITIINFNPGFNGFNPNESLSEYLSGDDSLNVSNKFSEGQEIAFAGVNVQIYTDVVSSEVVQKIDTVMQSSLEDYLGFKNPTPAEITINSPVSFSGKFGKLSSPQNGSSYLRESELTNIINDGESIGITGFNNGGNNSGGKPISIGFNNKFNIDFLARESQGTEVQRKLESYISRKEKEKVVDASLTLKRIESLTGVKPAMIYIVFTPKNVSLNVTKDQKKNQGDEDYLDIIIVTSQGQPIRKRITGVNKGQVLKLTQEMRGYITDPNNVNGFKKSSKELYNLFIGPIEKDLKAQKIHNLVFLVDAGLRGLPFSALYDGEQYLIEKYSVGLMPSLNLSDTTYESIKGASILGMGANKFSELNPLPAVPIELETITQKIGKGKKFLNTEFSLANLKSQRQITPYRIIHLGTHGEFKPGPVGESYIQLGDNSKLKLDEIKDLGWNSPPVDLLVLSACRTAVGDEKAELGFAGLAVAAGVRTAVGSLWYVSDEGTLGLMTTFYEKLGKYSTKSESLRQAQIAMIKGNVRIQNGQLITPDGVFPLPEELKGIVDKNVSHPYFWSAFTMIGSPW